MRHVFYESKSSVRVDLGDQAMVEDGQTSIRSDEEIPCMGVLEGGL
jgi:hypothetical protein